MSHFESKIRWQLAAERLPGSLQLRQHITAGKDRQMKGTEDMVLTPTGVEMSVDDKLSKTFRQGGYCKRN